MGKWRNQVKGQTTKKKFAYAGSCGKTRGPGRPRANQSLMLRRHYGKNIKSKTEVKQLQKNSHIVCGCWIRALAVARGPPIIPHRPQFVNSKIAQKKRLCNLHNQFSLQGQHKMVF